MRMPWMLFFRLLIHLIRLSYFLFAHHHFSLLVRSFARRLIACSFCRLCSSLVFILNDWIFMFLLAKSSATTNSIIDQPTNHLTLRLHLFTFVTPQNQHDQYLRAKHMKSNRRAFGAYDEVYCTPNWIFFVHCSLLVSECACAKMHTVCVRVFAFVFRDMYECVFFLLFILSIFFLGILYEFAVISFHIFFCALHCASICACVYVWLCHSFCMIGWKLSHTKVWW